GDQSSRNKNKDCGPDKPRSCSSTNCLSRRGGRFCSCEKMPICCRSRAGLIFILPIHRGQKAVATSRNGLDPPRIFSRVGQAITKPLNCRVQSVVEIDECVSSPELGSELFTTHHLTLRLKQQTQDAKALLPHFDLGAEFPQLSGAKVERVGPEQSHACTYSLHTSKNRMGWPFSGQNRNRTIVTAFSPEVNTLAKASPAVRVLSLQTQSSHTLAPCSGNVAAVMLFVLRLSSRPVKVLPDRWGTRGSREKRRFAEFKSPQVQK